MPLRLHTIQGRRKIFNVLKRFSGAALIPARRMRERKRDFDAVPELAVLMADLRQELDAQRARVRKRGGRRQ